MYPSFSTSVRRTLLTVIGMLCFTLSQGQIETLLGRTDYMLDSCETRELNLEVGSISFFKDNEFAGNIMKGYSLPGLWIAPQVTYQPLKNIRLEAGAHALIYHGTYKYPNYAYRDIAKWKGSEYQRGAHLLPLFRGQIALHNTNIVVGHLYGGENHQLVLPLYNPELNLTADPENGLQVLFDNSRIHFDAWINWESFIFENSTHQEAFIAGFSSRFLLTKPTSKISVYLPIQGLAQHRGGEQDTAVSVQTLMNGAIGLGMRWNLQHKALKWLNFEADLLGYYQQAGTLWPFGGGSAQIVSAEAMFSYGLHLRADYFRSNQFISMLGSPYFGSVSTKVPGARFTDHPQTFHLALDYSRAFGKHYAIGAKVETYYTCPGNMSTADGENIASKSGLNTSFGFYFRIHPTFLLKKF